MAPASHASRPTSGGDSCSALARLQSAFPGAASVPKGSPNGRIKFSDLSISESCPGSAMRPPARIPQRSFLNGNHGSNSGRRPARPERDAAAPRVLKRTGDGIDQRLRIPGVEVCDVEPPTSASSFLLQSTGLAKCIASSTGYRTLVQTRKDRKSVTLQSALISSRTRKKNMDAIRKPMRSIVS